MTNLEELKRLAEALKAEKPPVYFEDRSRTNHVIQKRGIGGSDDSHRLNKAGEIILSLIQRVEEAEAKAKASFMNVESVIRHAEKLQQEAHEEGRLAGIEEAAKVADFSSKSATDKFDQRVDRARKGEKNLELAAATAAGMDHAARNIAQAIRALKEKAE